MGLNSRMLKNNHQIILLNKAVKKTKISEFFMGCALGTTTPPPLSAFYLIPSWIFKKSMSV